MNQSAAQIAALVGGHVVGDETVELTGLNGIKQARPGDLAFVDSPRYLSFLQTTSASAILVAADVDPVGGKTLIQVKDPRMAFAAVLKACETEQTRHPVGIHPTAVVGSNVKLGEDVALDAHAVIADGCEIGAGAVLYAGVYVGRQCSIGEKTIIHPNATIRERSVLGARCIIHANVAIGSDGFGYVPLDGIRFKIPQAGNVVIGDDVEIGSNSAVDRATFGSTVIGKGSKIDNLVQIGHNVELGEHSVIAGMTGVAGSATIGNHVTIGAQAGVAGHIDIGDGVTVGGRAAVSKSIEPGRVVSGYPIMDHGDYLRVLVALRHLPETARKVRRLEKRIRELEEQLHG